MAPRLEQATTRHLWAAFWVATALFLVALGVVISRMGTAAPASPPKDAVSSSAVSGSR